MASLVTFLLVARMGKERVSNVIVANAPSLGWTDLEFRPSVLGEVISLAKDNQTCDPDDKMSWKQLSRALKATCEPFYNSASKLDLQSFYAIVAEVEPIVASLNLNESKADPLLSAKRYAAKAIKVVDANDSVDYMASIRKALDKEIADLEAVYTKASEVSSEAFTAFIVDKATSNGTDEAGYAKLRSKKEAASATSDSEGTTED
jgi:hypothetical protein